MLKGAGYRLEARFYRFNGPWCWEASHAWHTDNQHLWG
jgi:hypothetical protein